MGLDRRPGRQGLMAISKAHRDEIDRGRAPPRGNGVLPCPGAVRREDIDVVGGAVLVHQRQRGATDDHQMVASRGGPVRSTGFSRVLPGVSVLEAEGVKCDVLILRNVAAPEPEEHRTRNDALILRNTAPHTAYRGTAWPAWAPWTPAGCCNP